MDNINNQIPVNNNTINTLNEQLPVPQPNLPIVAQAFGYAPEVAKPIVGPVMALDQPILPVSENILISSEEKWTPVNEKKTFFSLIDTLPYPKRLGPYRPLIGHYDTVREALMDALATGMLPHNQLKTFIEQLPLPISKMYFYAHLAKTLHSLGQLERAKEACSQFVQLARSHHRPRYYADHQDISDHIAEDELRPDCIDICYGLAIMPKILSDQELAPLIESLHDTIQQTNASGILSPEEPLVFLLLSSKGYQLSDNERATITPYLESRDIVDLAFQLMDGYSEHEVALAILDLIKAIDDELDSNQMLTNFLKLGWQHLVHPEICSLYVSIAKAKNFIPNNFALPPGTEPRLTSTPDKLFLETDVGRLDIMEVRLSDAREVEDGEADNFNNIHQFIFSLDDPEKTRGALSVIQDNYDYKITIDEVISHLSQLEFIPCTDYVTKLIANKLRELGYTMPPSGLVTLEDLAGIRKQIPHPFGNYLEATFPSDQIVSRQMQYAVGAWLIQTNPFDRLDTAIAGLEESADPLSKAVLTVLRPNPRKRKAELQLGV